MEPDRLRFLPYVSRALSVVAWPFMRLLNRFLDFRFPSPAAPVPGEGKADDGRYDYGLSQPEYGIRLEKGIRIPMRDGTELHGDVFRPDATGRFPVIMAEAPYPRHIWDSLYIAAGEGREVVNRTNRPASMLVIIG